MISEKKFPIVACALFLSLLASPGTRADVSKDEADITFWTLAVLNFAGEVEGLKGDAASERFANGLRETRHFKVAPALTLNNAITTLKITPDADTGLISKNDAKKLAGVLSVDGFITGRIEANGNVVNLIVTLTSARGRIFGTYTIPVTPAFSRSEALRIALQFATRLPYDGIVIEYTDKKNEVLLNLGGDQGVTKGKVLYTFQLEKIRFDNSKFEGAERVGLATLEVTRSGRYRSWAKVTSGELPTQFTKISIAPVGDLVAPTATLVETIDTAPPAEPAVEGRAGKLDKISTAGTEPPPPVIEETKLTRPKKEGPSATKVFLSEFDSPAGKGSWLTLELGSGFFTKHYQLKGDTATFTSDTTPYPVAGVSALFATRRTPIVYGARLSYDRSQIPFRRTLETGESEKFTGALDLAAFQGDVRWTRPALGWVDGWSAGVVLGYRYSAFAIDAQDPLVLTSDTWGQLTAGLAGSAPATRRIGFRAQVQAIPAATLTQDPLDNGKPTVFGLIATAAGTFAIRPNLWLSAQFDYETLSATFPDEGGSRGLLTPESTDTYQGFSLRLTYRPLVKVDPTELIN